MTTMRMKKTGIERPLESRTCLGAVALPRGTPLPPRFELPAMDLTFWSLPGVNPSRMRKGKSGELSRRSK